MSSLVVMGVAGCGKSSLGGAVATALGQPLVEGDDFHPESSKAKMRCGVALTDADRRGWLATLGEQLARHPMGMVLTCSALKRAYRDQLRAASAGLRFAFLEIDEASARQRVATRPAHLFPPTLVASQFATLEPPLGEAGVLRLDATLAPETLLRQTLHWLADSGTDTSTPP
jgi:gluconokinase